MSVRNVRIGDVLERNFDDRAVELDQTYKVAGVFGGGRGMFEREPIRGSDTKYKELRRLAGDQLVYSRLKAFEGAIAFVPPALDGYFVSKEFPQFRIDESQVERGFLSQLLHWEGFARAMTLGSKGIGARRERLNETDFENLVIPLPDLPEQRRIASRLDWLAKTMATNGQRRPDSRNHLQLLPRLSGIRIRAWDVPAAVISDLCVTINDLVRPGEDPGPAEEFVGLEHVESHSGRRVGSRRIGDEKGRKFRFQPGDVLFGYLRPYLNKVWGADRHGLCSVEQYVLRAAPDVDPDLLAHVLRSDVVLESAIDLTHSLQLPRLRSGLLMGMSVPDVRKVDSLELAALDDLSDRQVRLSRLTAKSVSIEAALLPAARNEEFARLR